ncbi:MAG: peptide chain release factor family protein [Planctomycetota bacterium]|jgi:hypothetical protein
MKPWPHPACLADDELLAFCDERRSRGSGPGGQHRNKVETRVEFVHRPTGLVAAAGERRKVPPNRSMALRRLRLRLAVEHRVDPPAEPSDLWRSRCRGGRIACSPSHRDYPSLLAEAMDRLEEHANEPRPAAEVQGCTPSQLVALLRDHGPALGQVNRRRVDGNRKPLR